MRRPGAAPDERQYLAETTHGALRGRPLAARAIRQEDHVPSGFKISSSPTSNSKAITRVHAVDRGLGLLKSPAMPRISMYQQPLKTLKKMYPQYAR